jgi:hypothetical protein
MNGSDGMCRFESNERSGEKQPEIIKGFSGCQGADSFGGRVERPARYGHFQVSRILEMWKFRQEREQGLSGPDAFYADNYPFVAFMNL